MQKDPCRRTVSEGRMSLINISLIANILFERSKKFDRSVVKYKRTGIEVA